MYFLGKKNQKMIFEFIWLLIKCMFKSKLNFYERELESILDEYNYVLEYKKEWSKYK